MINSDDILYLIIHLGFNPILWVNRFGYRQLEPFEVHAAWVLWREIGVRMGCKYMPVTVEQALEWRKVSCQNCSLGCMLMFSELRDQAALERSGKQGCWYGHV